MKFVERSEIFGPGMTSFDEYDVITQYIEQIQNDAQGVCNYADFLFTIILHNKNTYACKYVNT